MSEREQRLELALQDIKDCCCLTGMTYEQIAVKMATLAQNALRGEDDEARTSDDDYARAAIMLIAEIAERVLRRS